MVRTQIADANSEGVEFMIFEPNFDGLEEKCLLAPETLTNTNINDSSIVLVLDKLIFQYLKTRHCKYYTLHIVYIMKQHIKITMDKKPTKCTKI